MSTPFFRKKMLTSQKKTLIISFMEINFSKVSDFAICPSQNTDTDAGYDLYSTENCSIDPLERRLVSSGIKIEIPKGHYGRIAPRSGLAVKKGIDVMAGVIDSGYRGIVKVLLVNLGPQSTRKSPYENFFGSHGKVDIKQGDRIAQIIIEKCHSVTWIEKEELSDSERNEGGFGSSGS
jgi:dUTP pyrophosphatase